MKNNRFIIPILFAFILISCKKENNPEIQLTVYQSVGNIQQKLDEFKNALGNLNNTTGVADGRREINWEGIPDSLLDKALPNDFFNTVGTNVPASRQKGLVYETGEVQASQTNFSHINPQAASQFASFSGNRSFANVNSSLWQIGFEEAGEHITASVNGFGMVFSDVDADNTTALEFFDGNESLGKFFVPPHDGNSSFSFLGVRFHNRNVTQIKVSHKGKLTDGGKDISEGGTSDFVVMDDVIYSEPRKK